ncbi:hypothetical protein DSO57_1024011 [Entomophthora muscae]|uniref:Uncharacterized protein n=1 Tax=Entomophthora muscae TaxID=34485 RepID=A0ACC2U0V7_9FUNG|nr:hypothetical protein DSO57_1024011 [Entomophthora muscae]
MYEHLKPAKHAITEDTELPVQLLALRIAKPPKAAGKEDTKEEIIDGVICQILVSFVPAVADPKWIRQRGVHLGIKR